MEDTIGIEEYTQIMTKLITEVVDEKRRTRLVTTLAKSVELSTLNKIISDMKMDMTILGNMINENKLANDLNSSSWNYINQKIIGFRKDANKLIEDLVNLEAEDLLDFMNELNYITTEEDNIATIEVYSNGCEFATALIRSQRKIELSERLLDCGYCVTDVTVDDNYWHGHNYILFPIKNPRDIHELFNIYGMPIIVLPIKIYKEYGNKNSEYTNSSITVYNQEYFV